MVNYLHGDDSINLQKKWLKEKLWPVSAGLKGAGMYMFPSLNNASHKH